MKVWKSVDKYCKTLKSNGTHGKTFKKIGKIIEQTLKSIAQHLTSIEIH